MKRGVAPGVCALLLAHAASAAPISNSDRINAGRYLVTLGDCMACHTIPGGKPFAGGAPLQTPFGAFVAPNITPDSVAGIGAWSEEDFRRAVKEGISPGGKRLYPAMPYPSYASMSNVDVAKMWSYMRTVQPVRQAAPANQLRFPFNIRATMVGWNWLFFHSSDFKIDRAKSVAWNRGAYLVVGPGHCGACHTAKNLFGADTSPALAGALLEGWFAPDITTNATRGIGDWSVRDVVAYLKTGHNVHSMASGPMAEAIENSTTQMTDADLTAISVYLKDAPASAVSATGALPDSNPQMKAGVALYRDNCEACHGADGKGESVIFPPLTDNPIVRQLSAQTLVRVVLAGTRAAQTEQAPTAAAMPSFAWRLSDTQVADLLTYVRGKWGMAAPVSASAVQQIRTSLVSNSKGN